ncbi:MAG: dTMP kinase [Anaerolineaceae bacterium]|nr:MAG: dTMP kinase [Anaerolineaceae bacterium]
MFITLEGVDGSGKTSHVPHLVEYLRGLDYKVYPAREPGGTPIGERIRSIVLDLRCAEIDHRTETLLFLAARAQFVEQVVKPHLKAGEIVISDRFADSTVAYQGYGHQQPLEVINTLVKYAKNGLEPDLTLLLDLDAEIGLKRKTITDDWNRVDAYPIDFHRRVHDGYLKLTKSDPDRWIVINANQSWENVQDALRHEIIKRIKN